MKFFRRLLELWARGKIFTRTLVVHGQPYPIKISPDAQLKYMKLGDAKFDCDLVDIAEAFVQENSIVWDVGANVGVFTFTAAAIATKGTVVSIEADAWLAGLLRQTRIPIPISVYCCLYSYGSSHMFNFTEGPSEVGVLMC